MFGYFTDSERDESVNSRNDQPSPSPCASPTTHNPNCPPLTKVPWGYWTEDDVSKLVIRGPNFLVDRIKIPVGQRIYKLAHVDMFYNHDDKVFHVASRNDNFVNQRIEARKRGFPIERMQREASSSQRTDSQCMLSPSFTSQSSLQSPPIGKIKHKQSTSQHQQAEKSPRLKPIINHCDNPASSFTCFDASYSTHPLCPMIIINFLFPGPDNKHMNLVLYFTRLIPPADILRDKSAIEKSVNQSSNSRPSQVCRTQSNHHLSVNQTHNPSLNTDANSTPNKSPKDSPLSQHRKLQRTTTTTSSNNEVCDSLNADSMRRTESRDSTFADALPDEQKVDGEVSACERDETDFDSTNQQSANYASHTIDIDRVTAFDRCLCAFLEGSDNERNARVKIIPRIAEGPWLVKKGVGCTPAILGKKIKQTYVYDRVKNYVEIDVDVASSMIAGRILALVKGAATSVVIELTFLLQGECEEELPESLIGGVRLVQVDLNKLPHLDENHQVNNARYW